MANVDVSGEHEIDQFWRGWTSNEWIDEWIEKAEWAVNGSWH